ncbi:MAG TPA: ABC transporter ATP-binding protein [Alphaproteobacteria bacterium]|mgnify:CR=1 FL=1|nr:ABC transporter ATP-binding protein [Rhodospirillaceae bacterium]HRJ12069.1 ABC transporter ATP-binding protein [Alphaproteobacteria bacterium]
MALLNVENLSMVFGGLVAVDGVSFRAEEGKITSVIGPNGAGKTTLFNCITGFYRPTSGKIICRTHGRDFDLTGMAGHHIVRQAGIARTFQNIRLFPAMTVYENMLVAEHGRISALATLNPKRYAHEVAKSRALARSWLERMDLFPYANSRADALPYGIQRRVEIARALCTSPTLLCLDEPAAGLNHTESEGLAKLLLRITKEFNVSILLIEHDMQVVMNISDHIVVLDYGRRIAEGTASEVSMNPDVIKAYLGEDAHAA